MRRETNAKTAECYLCLKYAVQVLSRVSFCCHSSVSLIHSLTPFNQIMMEMKRVNPLNLLDCFEREMHPVISVLLSERSCVLWRTYSDIWSVTTDQIKIEGKKISVHLMLWSCSSPYDEGCQECVSLETTAGDRKEGTEAGDGKRKEKHRRDWRECCFSSPSSLLFAEAVVVLSFFPASHSVLSFSLSLYFPVTWGYRARIKWFRAWKTRKCVWGERKKGFYIIMVYREWHWGRKERQVTWSRESTFWLLFGINRIAVGEKRSRKISRKNRLCLKTQEVFCLLRLFLCLPLSLFRFQGRLCWIRGAFIAGSVNSGGSFIEETVIHEEKRQRERIP